MPISAIPTRQNPPRLAKSKANNALLSYTRAPPTGAYRISSILDLSGVQVSVAPSNFPDAGLGAFLTFGLAEDGTVPPGTILTEYGGVHFTAPADILRVESDEYHSDYLWGGLNPHNGVYTIVDAFNSLTGYGGFINEGFEHSNTELVFGTDNKLYVSALTTIALNEELLLSYGAPFWLEPSRWYKLSANTQHAILSFYKCLPPSEPNPYCTVPMQEDFHPTMNSEENGYDLTLPNGSTDTLEDDVLTTLPHATVPPHLPIVHHSTMTTDLPAVIPLEARRRMSLCFGSSLNDTTRISLPYLDPLDPILYQLQDAMDATTTRAQAPHILRQLLLDNSHITLLYWKRQDDTHRQDSPPDGACGWHTLIQANYRRQTGMLLDLYDPSTLAYAVDFLTDLANSPLTAAAEGAGSIEAVIHYIVNKHHTGCTEPLPIQHQLLSTDFATLCHRDPASLFTQIPQGNEAYSRMPQDTTGAWLPHFASSGPNCHDGILPLSTLPLTEILSISKGDTFAQLSSGHYWLFPNSSVEHLQCNQAIDELATYLWDSSRGTTVPFMIPPNHQDLGLANDHPTFTGISNSIQDYHLTPTDATVAQAMVNRSDGAEIREKIQQCCGISENGRTRLMLGTVPQSEFSRLISTLHKVPREQAPDILHNMLLRQESQILLSYWKQSSHIDFTSASDLESGWYTVIFLRWRDIYGTELDFDDPLHRRRGSTVLTILSANAARQDKPLKDSLLAVRNWMDDSTTGELSPTHHLRRNDFTELSGESPLALFLFPDNLPITDDSLPIWVPLIQHPLQSAGTGLVTLSDLLTIAKSGELAMVAGQRYYPLHALRNEDTQCTSAIWNLASAIWDTLHEALHLELPSAPHPTRKHTNSATSLPRPEHQVPVHLQTTLPRLSPLSRCWFPDPTPQHAEHENSNLPTIADLTTSISEGTIRCYGTSLDGTTKLALGPTTTDTLQYLLESLQNGPQDNAMEILRSSLLLQDTSLPLHYWKKPTEVVTTYVPEAASGWYTLAFLRWRSLYGTSLNFEDPDDRNRGAIILSILADDAQGNTNILTAQEWMASSLPDDFPTDHQLMPSELTTLCGHSPIALFEFSAPADQPEETNPALSDWAPMIHHSLQPSGADHICLKDLLTIARNGELAIVRNLQYWPLPTLWTEEEQCNSALLDLARCLWDTTHGVQRTNTTISPVPTATRPPVSLPLDPHLTYTPAALDLAERLSHLREDVYNTLDSGSPKDSHLRVATFNINGLDSSKLPILLTYITVKNIDVLVLQDTRLNKMESKTMSALIRSHYNHEHIQVRSAPVTSPHTAEHKVGGQLVIVRGRWAKSLFNFYSDPSQLGIVTSTSLKAQGYDIMILSSYWPIKASRSDNDQLWNKVKRSLSALGLHKTPLDYAKDTIHRKLLQHCRQAANIAILAGDLNSTWNSSYSPGGCHAGLSSWATSANWTNPLHSLSLAHSNPICTHWIGHHVQEGVEHLGKSWIDHILLHAHGNPQFIRGGSESHNDWITISDHRPLWIDIHLPRGGTDPLPPSQDAPPPPRTLPRGKKQIMERYRKIVKNKVARLSDTLSPSDKLAHIARISVQACPTPGDKPPSFYNSSKFRDGWSPLYIAHLTALSSITEMRQHMSGASKRRLWRHPEERKAGISKVTTEWETQLRKLTWPSVEDKTIAYGLGRGPHFWRSVELLDSDYLTRELMTLEKHLKKQMHGRNRSEWRHAINSQSAARENARLQGKKAAVIRSIFGTHMERYDMNLLRLSDGSTLTDPVAIHETFANHFEQWHQGNGRQTFFDDHIIDWEDIQSTREDFLTYAGHVLIPRDILIRIWDAIVAPTQKFPGLSAKLQEVTSTPITIDELRAAIQRAPASSVPGPSGLSYAMMKEWPDEVLLTAHSAMTTIWDTGTIPSWWQWKWICPIPKVDPETATLDDLRPIALLETTRKLWMGIIVGRITSVWERDSVLSSGQYGFRRNRSTEAPTLQVINALEEAEESATEIHGSSWDIRRAFDSVPKSILVMSWERLGVPKRIANYIVDLDRECLTVPLTPHAKHLLNTAGRPAFSSDPTSTFNARGFFGVTGTPQGDTPSPTNWNAAFDILLRALETANLHPFLVRSGSTLHPVQDTAYADDLFSISARKEGLQLKADIVSAFAGIFGIKIATTKLRTFAKCWGSEPSGWRHGDYSLLVRDERWEPTEVPVLYANLGRIDSVFRYLGVHVDSNNLYRHQHRLLLQQIREVARTARHKQASPETIDMALTTSLHRKISFPAKFMPWSLQQLRQLDPPLNGLLKKHLMMLPATANAALYMATDVGGMGLTRLSDQIILDKYAMLHRGLHSDSHTRQATNGLMERSLRIGLSDTEPGFEATVAPTTIPHTLLYLLEACRAANLRLRRGGLTTSHTPTHMIDTSSFSAANQEDLMHYRIAMQSDVMIFTSTGNIWNEILCAHFPGLFNLLPANPPNGNRRLRIGQYWSSVPLQGMAGHIIEILGISPEHVTGRTWVNQTHPDRWEKDTPATETWFTPLFAGTSLGAGASETFPLASFLQAEMWHHRFSQEVFVQGRKGVLPTVKRALMNSTQERPPYHTDAALPHALISPLEIDRWDTWLLTHQTNRLTVYTDGSMRYAECISDKLFGQPKSIRKATYAQGGLLFHVGDDLAGPTLTQSLTVTLGNGTSLNLTQPSSMELYSILLAVHLLSHSHLAGTIYTDFLEAVKVSKNPHTFRNMGRKANLPIYELLLHTLSRSPDIRLEFVKAHGPIKKQSQWTTQQWGNYHADRIAKNNTLSFSAHHIDWQIQPLEDLVKLHPSWHWIAEDNHLALEPLRYILRRQTHLSYMIRRDAYRIDRGDGIKWQQAHMGLVDDVWHLNRLSLTKRATIHRLLYDKGHHGGNRAKTTKPAEIEEAVWIGCGLCGEPDSQHHWIRQCAHHLITPIRLQALDSATEVLQQLLFSKGQYQAKRDCFNICSEILHAAEVAPGGEQLWLGIIPTGIISDITPRIHPSPLDTASKISASNLWKRTLRTMLTILSKAVKAMWSIKEADRRNELVIQRDIIPHQRRKRRRLPDIRPYLRDLRRRIGPLTINTILLEENPIDDLLRQDSATAPCTTSRLRRLSSLLPTPKPSLTARPTTTPHHNFFALTRRHQDKQKRLRQRTLNSASWDKAFEMDWLRDAELEYPDEHMDAELSPGLETEDADEIDSDSSSNDTM